MKKERWDNRMSLWTRLFYGVPNMETWYQQNPTHQDTIRYYTDLCKTDELPAINSTFKQSKEYITKYFPKRVLPEMTYEQIISIIDSLKSIRPFFAEPFLKNNNIPTYPLNFRKYCYGYEYHFKEKDYTISEYKEDVLMGYCDNIKDSLCFFYYWEDKNWTASFSDFANMNSYERNLNNIKMPIFFNPKTFRDYALLCKYFSQPIKELHEREIEEAKQAELKKLAEAEEAQKKKEYEIRENQIKLLNELKNDLQSIQDNAAKQMEQVAQEDVKIAKRLSNNNVFLEQLDKITKEGEEHNFEII